jgi:pyruvate kinase
MTGRSARHAWQHTKIVCTLGPATDGLGVLEALVRGGMDVARINMSHGTHADHAARIESVRSVSRGLAEPVAILADLPGPKFRLGELEGGSRRLEDGMSVVLAAEALGSECLPVRNRALLNALRPGESVYLADGSVALRVTSAAADRVTCEVVFGGTVRSGSGINVPESELPGLVPTQADRAHLAFAAAQGVDWIGVSFVQSAEDLWRVRACLPDRDAPLLMAKIEKRRALANLDAIVESADGVMVARGDLGVETDLAEIPLAQKRIIAAANARGRPAVTATQMLESMVEHERPTRAEVTDVANAVLDGTDAVMLSAESAVGRNPAAAARILQRVLAATEAEYAPQIAGARLDAAQSVSVDEAVAFAACQLAQRVDAKAIVGRVSDHRLPAAIARFRPAVPIVAATQSPALCTRLAMVCGVSPLHDGSEDAHSHIDIARDWLFARTFAQSGDRVVVVSAASHTPAAADALRVTVLRA